MEQNSNTFKYADVLSSYARRADEVKTEEALDILSQIYIDNCGISLSERTVAENAAFFWIRRWREETPGLPRRMGLYDVMAMRSEEYRLDKERIDRYDVTIIRNESLQQICLEMLDEYEDDATKIALCAGIHEWIRRTHEIEESYKRFLSEKS